MPKRTKKHLKNKTGTLAKARQFVTTSEVAAVLGRTQKSVRELFEKGDLAGKKIGGRWLMHRNDFAALIAPAVPLVSGSEMASSSALAASAEE